MENQEGNIPLDSTSSPSSESRRRRRRHRTPKKKSLIEKVSNFFVAENYGSYRIGKSKGKKVKKKKALAKKLLEITLWSIIIGLFLMGVFELLSQVEIKDRRNKNKKWRAYHTQVVNTIHYS